LATCTSSGFEEEQPQYLKN